MKKLILIALVLASFVSFSVVGVAQEKKAKGGGAAAAMAAQLFKQLEKAELTEEQTTKAKEIFGKAAAEVSKLHADAGITADMLKKRFEAGKSAKESGKKGKEMQEAVLSAMGLSDEQKKVFAETEAKLDKARIEIGKLLTPEQMEKLPAAAQSAFKAKEGGKKAKASS